MLTGLVVVLVFIPAVAVYLVGCGLIRSWYNNKADYEKTIRKLYMYGEGSKNDG